MTGQDRDRARAARFAVVCARAAASRVLYVAKVASIRRPVGICQSVGVCQSIRWVEIDARDAEAAAEEAAP